MFRAVEALHKSSPTLMSIFQLARVAQCAQELSGALKDEGLKDHGRDAPEIPLATKTTATGIDFGWLAYRTFNCGCVASHVLT